MSARVRSRAVHDAVLPAAASAEAVRVWCRVFHRDRWREVGGSDCTIIPESSPNLGLVLRVRVLLYREVGKRVIEKITVYRCPVCRVERRTRDLRLAPIRDSEGR